MMVARGCSVGRFHVLIIIWFNKPATCPPVVKNWCYTMFSKNNPYVFFVFLYCQLGRGFQNRLKLDQNITSFLHNLHAEKILHTGDTESLCVYG